LLLLVAAFLLSAADVRANDKSFLWKAQSGSSTAYILGSIHAMKSDIYPLDRKIENAFQESAYLVFEIDLDLDLNNVLPLMMLSAMYQGDDALKKHLTPATYELAVSELKKTGLDIQLFEKCKPWFLAVSLETIELVKMGFDPEMGIDKHFFNKSGSKKVLAFETAEFQINLFNQFDDSDQESFLLATIRELNMLKGEMTRMVDAWKTGDAGSMESILSQNISGNPRINQIYDKLLFQRNRNMTSKIKDYLKTGDTYFIVVGAAHLVGKKGIIELLRESGYSVNQM
jgi:uncharacterized protein YbaP (TraB family)